MLTRVKLTVALVVVMGIISSLIVTAIARSTRYYMTVDELLREGRSAIHKNVTISGLISGKSLNWNPTDSELRFSIHDSDRLKQLPVIYHGSRPDGYFSIDWPVVLSGRLSSSGEFVAEKLLVKCPSKYQAS